MFRASSLVVLLATVGFAGCITENLPNASDGPIQPVLYAGAPLWSDPQNTPHPNYEWPTLSSPPANVTDKWWWQPINATPLPNHISSIEHAAHIDGIKQGAGIAIFGSIAVLPVDPEIGGVPMEAYVVDIRDPMNPQEISSFTSVGRGAAIIAYPDGRLVTVIAASQKIEVVDITDPMRPDVLKPITVVSHKLGVVPGTPIVYNAASNGGNNNPLLLPGPGSVDPSKGNGVTEIYDLSDPEKPTKKVFANGYSCHHIFFWINATQDRERAICAGIEYTQIWDIKDPLDPKVIVSIPVHYGKANAPSSSVSVLAFSHSAGMNIAGNVLYVGDEMGGGGIPPGCGVGTGVPEGSPGTPLGATWFYDISTETDPKILGYYSATYDLRAQSPGDSCTTHHGRIVPDKEGRDLLAMSYYGQGVELIDFTGVNEAKGMYPKLVSSWREGSNTWETWYHQGYLFTGDLNRGMDVFTFK